MPRRSLPPCNRTGSVTGPPSGHNHRRRPPWRHRSPSVMPRRSLPPCSRTGSVTGPPSGHSHRRRPPWRHRSPSVMLPRWLPRRGGPSSRPSPWPPARSQASHAVPGSEPSEAERTDNDGRAGLKDSPDDHLRLLLEIRRRWSLPNVAAIEAALCCEARLNPSEEEGASRSRPKSSRLLGREPAGDT
jgi:hypothetical protein